LEPELIARLQKAGKSFGEHRVLDQIDLEIRPGRLYGLVGENGSGKTTLIHLIAGMLAPDAGTVAVWGKDPFRHWQIRRQIGILPEEDTYFPELTAREYLGWVARLRQISDAESRDQMERLAQGFSLGDRLDHLVGSLSYGMRRKVLLTGAILGHPRLLLLDEPTNGLDSQSTQFLSELLAAHRIGDGSAVLASHDRRFVEEICTNLLVLEKGRLIGKTDVQGA